MMGVVSAIIFLLRAVLGNRTAIAAKSLALRQRLAPLYVSGKPPKLRRRDRILWVWLSRPWPGRRSSSGS